MKNVSLDISVMLPPFVLNNPEHTDPPKVNNPEYTDPAKWIFGQLLVLPNRQTALQLPGKPKRISQIKQLFRLHWEGLEDQNHSPGAGNNYEFISFIYTGSFHIPNRARF